MAKPESNTPRWRLLPGYLKIDPEQFDTVWQTTPVPVTPPQARPSTDEARRFAAACSARVTQWMARAACAPGSSTTHPRCSARRWPFVGGRHAVDEGFTHVVDHLQDPAEWLWERVGKMADRATQPGSPPQAKTRIADRHRNRPGAISIGTKDEIRNTLFS